MNSAKRYFNGMTHEDWLKVSKQIWDDFLAGKTLLDTPANTYCPTTDIGKFILIQPRCMLDEAPGIYVRSDGHYRGALKIFVPASFVAGNKLQIARASKSGKSYIAKVVP